MASPREPAGEKGTADRIEADDGAFWVRLVTRQALDREGIAMGHCVGDGDYDRLAGGEDIADDAIWSLRNAGGVSILTVRIRERELDFASGYSNLFPGKGASMQVRHLATAFTAAGHRLRVDEDSGIVLLDDGRTFRRDRLPPDVVAAREAAERAREAERAARRRSVRESGPGAGYEIGRAQVFFRRYGRDSSGMRPSTLERLRRLPVGLSLFGHEATYLGPWQRFQAYEAGAIVADAGLPYVAFSDVPQGGPRPQDVTATAWRLIEASLIETVERVFVGCNFETLGDEHNKLRGNGWDRGNTMHRTVMARVAELLEGRTA